ncbi:dnaJ homolog subfamily C member 9-like isoform X2 [Saccoglossus kowalevskii]
MPRLLESCEQLFGTSDLYKILGVEKQSTERQGEVDDEIDVEQNRDWLAYWKLIYKELSVKDIKEFEEKYKGSDEELNDLKSAYMSCQGDMEMILNTVLCATFEDEDRFQTILKDCVDKTELPPFDAFTKENKKMKKARKKKAMAEAAEAEDVAKRLGLGDSEDALQAMIKRKQNSRQQEMNDFFSSLEAKYANPKSKKKAKTNSKSGSKKTK